jgi:hypothetical protein
MDFLASIRLSVLVVLALEAASPGSQAATNEWLKPGSGDWEEPYWSLGRLPRSEDVVLFHNSGFKALAIGPSTVTSAPQSLSIQSFTIDAPTNSSNLLLLNWAGFNVPLSVSANFVIGVNGALVSHNSSLVASNFSVGATAQFLESAASFTNGVVGMDTTSELDLTNSFFSASALQLGGWQPSSKAVMNQSGGTNQIGTLAIYPGSDYTLSDGGLLIGNALEMHTIGKLGDARFTQAGGEANFDSAGNVLGSNPNTFARLSLSAGNFQTRNLSMNNGSFVQTGGTNLVGVLLLSPNVFTSGSYSLSNGFLLSSNFTAGDGNGNEPPRSVFTQTGGIHTNGCLTLSGTERYGLALPFGEYLLSCGLLVSSNERVMMGSMSQAGGTNLVGDLGVSGGGSYHLSGGVIVSSNVYLGTPKIETIFDQTGGDHRILNLLCLDRLVTYSLGAGTLTVSDIEVNPGGQLLVQGGAVTHSGLCTINGGLVTVGTPQMQLGQLRVTGSNTLFFMRPTNSTIDFLPGAGNIRFRDSHEIPWSPPGLFIQNWNATNGPNHIYIGTNSDGVTAWQLSLVTFSNPGGMPAGNYPAAILPTGELVPSSPAPTLAFTTGSDEMILFWSGGYRLYTSTNASGPYVLLTGANSPYTNALVGLQRFFRLQSE